MKKTRKGDVGSNNAYLLHRDKRLATTTPVTRVSQLKGLWNRVFAVYRMLVVQVVDRKGTLVSFRIVPIPPVTDGSRVDDRVFTVDLDDGDVAWGDLPSTAQLVDPTSNATIAYLGLTEEWINRSVPGFLYTGGAGARMALALAMPPKIPGDCSL